MFQYTQKVAIHDYGKCIYFRTTSQCFKMLKFSVSNPNEFGTIFF